MDEPSRKKVDLSRLPKWAQVLIVAATVLIVAGIALLIGNPEPGPVIPVSAIIAGVIAFTWIAWKSSRR